MSNSKSLNCSKHLKLVLFCLTDIVTMSLAFFAAIWLTNNSFWSNLLSGKIVEFPSVFAINVLMFSAFYLLGYFALKIHRIMWRFARYIDIIKLVAVIFFSWILTWGISFFVLDHAIRTAAYFVCLVVSVFFLIGYRMVLHVFAVNTPKSTHEDFEIKEHSAYRNVMVVGGGESGHLVIHDLAHNTKFNGRVVCVIDDDEAKVGRDISGTPIVGTRSSIKENAKKFNVDVIIFAIPSASPAERSAILRICSDTGCEVRVLTGIQQLVDGNISDVDVSKTRKINVEDLLGRDPIRIDLGFVKDYVGGKTVMVTGGGGSIGSELCRQLAANGVNKLIIFDIYENNTYDILNELKRNYPNLSIEAIIGSVRDTDRLDYVFSTYRPEIVYHAAAHKHVPLMEDSPNEAVKNNVFGTLNTVRAADKYGVKRFVMISTDKAVNPTNVMGATKRICEMIVQTYNKRSKTEYVAVRFGNVLGSNGSVIPLFKRQIEEGGPVTVTHPDIIRYFMTIPEAVSLVLQAGASAQGGEIFVLDMGNPVKIVDLAENLIRLSGYEPNKDIMIEFTGLRPGEKLYEELLMDEEGLKNTKNKLIHIGQPITLDEDQLFADLDELNSVMDDEDADIRGLIKKIVPTYKLPANYATHKNEEDAVLV